MGMVTVVIKSDVVLEDRVGGNVFRRQVGMLTDGTPEGARIPFQISLGSSQPHRAGTYTFGIGSFKQDKYGRSLELNAYALELVPMAASVARSVP